MESTLASEWVAARVWRFLVAPTDATCCAASRVWSHSTHTAYPRDGAERQEPAQMPASSSSSRPPLRFPHVVLPEKSFKAALWWAAKRVSPASLETLTLPTSLPQREAVGKDLNADSSGVGVALCRCADWGLADWTSWLLAAEVLDPRAHPGIPGGHVRLRPRGGLEARPSVPAALAVEAQSGTLGSDATALSPSPVALRTAAAAGHAEVVRVLVRARANIGSTDQCECTALHWAADKGHAEACRALLEEGAQVDAQDDDDWTSLCLAAEEGHADTCRVLLEARANVNLPDEDGRSPLWWAAWKRHEGLVALLVEYGADLLQGDESGITPKCLLAAMARGPGGRDAPKSKTSGD